MKRPELVTEIAFACGSQCCVLAIDARKRNASEADTETIWDVLIQGGRVNTNMNAFDWAQKSVENGAGEILLTSWDRDGTELGFDIEMVRKFSDNLKVPVIASGGAQGPESFIEVFRDGHADAALAATIFHDGRWTANRLKDEIKKANITVRTC